jgi:hypothetical protein
MAPDVTHTNGSFEAAVRGSFSPHQITIDLNWETTLQE